MAEEAAPASALSRAAFAELDVDGDGAVSRAEFAAWHQREVGAAPSEAEWQAFAEADADDDGAVSLQEFKESTFTQHVSGLRRMLNIPPAQGGLGEAAREVPSPDHRLRSQASGG